MKLSFEIILLIQSNKKIFLKSESNLNLKLELIESKLCRNQRK